MLKKIMRFLFLLIVALGISFNSLSQTKNNNKEVWYKIGEVTADSRSKKKMLIVKKADKYNAIKIKAATNPIKLGNLDIVYSKNAKEAIPYFADMQTGEETPAINLRGKNYNLKSVAFNYEALSEKGHTSKIVIYGLK